MNIDVELPPFALDCRAWLVATESEDAFDDEICDGPVLAILSTVVIDDDDFHSATAVISLALLSNEDRQAVGLGTDGVGPDGTNAGGFSADLRLSDADWDTGHARYFAPAPNGGLALMAEFSSEPNPPLELTTRFHELLASFSWAA